MANRTFKLKGVGYDSAGSVNVVLTVGGSEVFNGAVTVGTTNIFGTDLSETDLLTFELDESVTGDTAWVVSMTGTDHNSKIWLGDLHCNLVKPNMTIDYSWFESRLPYGDTDYTTQRLSAEDQTYVANQIGQSRLNAQKSNLYEDLLAGNAVIGTHAYYVQEANQDLGGKTTGDYYICDKSLSNGVRDGEAYDVTGAGTWPLIKSGSTLNMTVGLGVPSYVYVPNHIDPATL